MASKRAYVLGEDPPDGLVCGSAPADLLVRGNHPAEVTQLHIPDLRNEDAVAWLAI